ncbi:MAG TPA: DMT family transporter [Fimbriiglobus sp.]|jgi:drug/metabolite transporter (DMT)-like permease
MPGTGIKPYVWMFCGCGWFAAMSLLVRVAGDRVDWQVVAIARSGLATVIAFTLALCTGTRLVFARPRILWLRSFAGSLSMLTTFYALSRMHTSAVLTLTNTFPAWVAILSWPLAGERPARATWVAVVVAILGVALVTNAGELGVRPGSPPWLPPAAAVCASFFTAVAMLGLNRVKGVDPLAIVVHFSAVATLFCTAGYFLFDRRIGTDRLFESNTLLVILGVGVTATAGQVFLTLAFSRGHATTVSVVGLSQVVMVMAVEAVLGWKQFTPSMLAGTTLVLGPTAWLMLRARKAQPAVLVAELDSEEPEVVIE